MPKVNGKSMTSTAYRKDLLAESEKEHWIPGAEQVKQNFYT